MRLMTHIIAAGLTVIAAPPLLAHGHGHGHRHGCAGHGKHHKCPAPAVLPRVSGFGDPSQSLYSVAPGVMPPPPPPIMKSIAPSSDGHGK